MRNNVRREDPTVQHLLLGQMRSHTKNTQRLCKTKKLLISFCIHIKRLFNKGYTLTKLIFGWRANTAQSQLQQGLAVFLIRGRGEGLITSFYSHFMANAALILYIWWSIELLFFVSPESKLKYVLKQVQTSTGSMRALTMQSANCLPKLLSWRLTLQSWVRLSGIRKYSCFYSWQFLPLWQSFVLSDGQLVWNKKILVPEIDLFALFFIFYRT